MNINIRPDGAINRVHVSQNDVGRTLTFNLFNDSLAYTVPSGATVKIQGTKPSGFGFSETCTVSGNTVTIDTTEEMTDEFGYIDTELQISYSGNVIGTSNFVLVVEKNPHPSNTTDGTQITAQSLQVQIDELAEIIESGGSGLTDEAKQALLNCFAHVAWIDANGQTYYDTLEDALYPPANLESISCVYTQSGTVYTTDSLDDLKADLVVTAHYDDSTTQTVSDYTLSGTLTEGTSTITVTYGGKTTTFNVTVTRDPVLYRLTSSDFLKGKRLQGTATNVGGEYQYYNTLNSRMSYVNFDLLIEEGKTYQVVADITESGSLGLQVTKAAGLEIVEANEGGSIANYTNDPGWQSLTTTYTVPSGYGTSAMRLTFKNANNTALSSTFDVNSVVISEVTE